MNHTSFNRRVQMSQARQLVPRLVNASAAGVHGVSAKQLRLGKMNLRRTDFGVASAEHERLHVRRTVGQSATAFVDFTRQVRTGLATLASQPRGAAMLSDLNSGTNPDLDIASGRLVETNVHFRADTYNHMRYRHPGGRAQGSPAFRWNSAARAGNVTSDVFWNPSNHSVGGAARPAFIGLGHELVHAWRGRMGTAIERRQFQAPGLQNIGRYALWRDEFETVGLMPTPRLPNAPSENSLRAEHGIAARTNYSGSRPGILTGLAASLQTFANPQTRQRAQAALASFVG